MAEDQAELPKPASLDQDAEHDDPYCLKCGKSIAHNIPYKYEGATFHARCLICNCCGRNLVGKPFTVDVQNIFCGEVCKLSFETNPQGKSNDRHFCDSQENGGKSVLENSLSESLMEALDKINEEPVTKSFGRSGVYMPDPDQITDYPRHPSPSTSSSRLSLDGSIRSSFGAVSQSSLISDYSYDANRKPTKKILKNSHQPHRRAKKNVRWNDSDTTSIDSFDSISTTSSNLFHRARNGVNDPRQNWRAFERSPSPGSTGITSPQSRKVLSRPSSTPTLTPFKTSSPTKDHSSSYSSLPIHHTNSTVRSPFQQDMYFGSPPQSTTASSSSQGTKFKRKDSPLANIRVPGNTGVDGFEKLSRTIPSAALTRVQPSETDQKKSSSPVYKDEHVSKEEDNFVRKHNDNKSAQGTEFEEGTQEDRQRMHIYQIAQYGQIQKSNAAKVVGEMTTTKSAQIAFGSDDDKNDYDHLLPQNVDAFSLGREYGGHTNVPNMIPLRTKRISRSNRKEMVSYTDDDIEDALCAITKSDSESQPPPIPVKRARILSAQEVRQAPLASETNLQRSGSDPSRGGQASMPARVLSKDSPVRRPPPVPPKIKHKPSNKEIDRTILIQNRPQENNIENILPPPPEFAIDYDPDDQSSPKSDDVLKSASTSTLIAEQELSSNGITSKVDRLYSPVHTTSSLADQKDQSQNFFYSKKDRTIVQPEDHQFLTKSQHSLPYRHQQTHPSNYTLQKDWQTATAFSTHSDYDQKKDQDVHTPKFKISTEGKGNNLYTDFVPLSQHYPPSKGKRTSTPHRPAPPPPLLKTCITEEKVSSEITDTQQLLADLGITDDGLQLSQSEPVCVVCLKEIQTPRECITFNSKSHHLKCFFCNKCHVNLSRDVKPCIYRNSLYCWDCFKSVSSNSSLKVYREYHRAPAGGQITTV